ncbi:hypothetical protein ACOME3_007864 [Neoechinorhynchus agilis]
MEYRFSLTNYHCGKQLLNFLRDFLCQFSSGVLAYKLGPQRVLIISVTGSSLCTLATPFAANISPVLIFLVRFFLGFLASVNWPALLHLLSEWAPAQERSQLIAISNSGAQLGTIVALPLSAVLCEQSFLDGWPLVFYVSRPEDHHFIPKRELEYICQNKPISSASGEARKAVGFFTLLTNISTYSKDVLNFNVKKSGFLGSVPYIFYWLMTLICGVMCDKLINAGTMDRTKARKVFTALGNFLPAIFIFLTGFVTTKTAWAGTLLFTLVLATTGFNTGGGMYCSANDMAPRFAGIIWGISNTFGILPGFILTGTAEVQPWALDKDEIVVDELEEDDETADL